MSSAFSACGAIITELRERLLDLEKVAAPLQLAPLAGREWFQLLEQKLMPQLSDSAFLVAAVVGGTNIGKSVIFNHIAGTRASAVTPLASGTKHPVCLVPDGFGEAHQLDAIFPSFELHPWERSEAALEESERNWLFWRSAPSLPPNLLVLDTPDIDSDARVNWQRADMIRRVADVLIAVLTQQKYNDAAVKEFFRRAAAEDKVVLIVFNQVHLPDDEPYWPLWLRTFCLETGIRPHVIYLTPHDRRAADEGRLPFFERSFAQADQSGALSEDKLSTASSQASGPEPAPGGQHVGRKLNEDLSSLRFGEIKLRTLASSLRLLLEPSGIDGFLSDIRARSQEFQTAGELLSTHKLAEVEDWPAVPNAVIVQHIRAWWQTQREGWSAAVHSFYNRIGKGLTSAYRLVHDKVRGPQTPPLSLYRAKEWEAVLDIVDDVYNRLNWFLELGNPLLQPRLAAMLGARSREDLITVLRSSHATYDLESELEKLIAQEMESFRSQSPQFYRSLKQLDAVAAAVRPVTSIALFVTGFGPVGHLAADAAVTSAVHVAGDVVAGGITSVVGESWISQSASAGLGWLEARFRRIHELFAGRRAAWLAELLQQNLLGTLPLDLQTAAQIPQGELFGQTKNSVAALRRFLADQLTVMSEGVEG